MELLHSLKIGLLAVGTLVSSWFGATPALQNAPVTPVIEQAPNLGGYNPVGGLTYRLQASIGSTDTTIYLSSFKNRSNLPLTMSLINSSVGYGTLDPQNPARSEFISFTGITQNTDGTARLTGVTRGLSDIYPFTASTTQRVSHSGQSIFILSDSPQHFQEYAVKQNNELISGAWTASSTNPWKYDNLYNETSTSTSKNIQTAGWSYANFVRSNENTTINATTTAGTGHGFIQALAPTNGSDLVNKTYADALAIAGAPNASLTVKGIVQEATITQINAFTDTGSTGAKLFMTPQDFHNSNLASTTPTITYATSTNQYTAQAISMTSGKTVLFWGSCARNGTHTVTLTYRNITDPATTTLATSIVSTGQNGLMQSLFGSFTATTTNTLYVAIGSNQGCDQGSSLMTQYFPN